MLKYMTCFERKKIQRKNHRKRNSKGHLRTRKFMTCLERRVVRERTIKRRITKVIDMTKCLTCLERGKIQGKNR